ncbi:MAG: DUF2752 domain-containing protein [Acidobacteriota bacterium]|nr:DUF2752 domain-containing protein [Acidobacteriota bacterium]
MSSRPVRHTHGVLVCLAPLLCLLAAASLIRWPPGSSLWYPVCPFAQYLHLLCPGCGATRALSALLRGHLREAWAWNPLFVVVSPLLFANALRWWLRAFNRTESGWLAAPHEVRVALLGVAAVFTVVRNL